MTLAERLDRDPYATAEDVAAKLLDYSLTGNLDTARDAANTIHYLMGHAQTLELLPLITVPYSPSARHAVVSRAADYGRNQWGIPTGEVEEKPDAEEQAKRSLTRHLLKQSVPIGSADDGTPAYRYTVGDAEPVAVDAEATR